MPHEPATVLIQHGLRVQPAMTIQTTVNLATLSASHFTP
jgi:hypothetical protein